MTKAYVTLLTSEGYVPGALTLGQTLKLLHTSHKLAVLVDTSVLSGHSLKLLQDTYDELIQINSDKIIAPVEQVAAKLGRAELAATFSKILLWNLTQYDSVVYIDADTLPLKPLDGLFDAAEDAAVAAAPDIGWPDIFNSGLMVLKPDEEVFGKLLTHAGEQDASFDGADQGLFNEFFHLRDNGHKWNRLPFIYNVTPSTHYQYRPALTRFFSEIHLVHFIGAQKPWHAKTADKSEFEELWWAKFNSFFTAESDRIQLLSALPSEGYNLKFTKLVNQWDEQTPLPALDSLSLGEADKVFPWEHRERVAPTRVFDPIQLETEDVQKTPVKVSLDSPPSGPSNKNPLLKQAYSQFKGPTEFDPEKSLEQVSKIPMQLLKKKNKE